MKVSVNTKEKQFEPVEVTLTLETFEELRFWTCLANASTGAQTRLVNQNLYSNMQPFTESYVPHTLWYELNEVLRQRE